MHGPVCAYHASLSERGEPLGAPLVVRLGVEERETLERAAAIYGLSLSESARRAIAGIPFPRPAPTEGVVRFISELHRVGSNLNQAVRALNIANKTGALEPNITRDLSASCRELATFLVSLVDTLAAGEGIDVEAGDSDEPPGQGGP